MFKWVYLWRTKPKIQANKIALKNEGTLIPTVLKIWMVLSIQVSFFNAEIIPKKIPSTIAIQMAETANKKVLGKVSLSTSVTCFPCLVNDSLKYGAFIANDVFPMENKTTPLYLAPFQKV